MGSDRSWGYFPSSFLHKCPSFPLTQHLCIPPSPLSHSQSVSVPSHGSPCPLPAWIVSEEGSSPGADAPSLQLHWISATGGQQRINRPPSHSPSHRLQPLPLLTARGNKWVQRHRRGRTPGWRRMVTSQSPCGLSRGRASTTCGTTGRRTSVAARLRRCSIGSGPSLEPHAESSRRWNVAVVLQSPVSVPTCGRPICNRISLFSSVIASKDEPCACTQKGRRRIQNGVESASLPCERNVLIWKLLKIWN